MSQLTEAEFQALRRDSADNIEAYLLDADGLDAVFFLHSLALYVAARLALNYVVGGRLEAGMTATARQYSKQQYVMLFAQKGVVLPVCALGWMYGWLPPELIYLLTGVYVLSDSMLNASPVRGGSWGGNYAVHAHHFFTMLLCAVGAHLPPRPVMGGAFCIFICEAGSLWLTVAILHPTPRNIKIRFYSFVLSRIVAFAIFFDMLRCLEQMLTQALMLLMMIGLGLDNWRTLHSMGGAAGLTGGSMGRSDSLAASLNKVQ